MRGRERKYHRDKRFKRKFGFDSFPLSKNRNPISFITEIPPCSNFGIFVPSDICRNTDGTPKKVKSEFQHPGNIVTHH